uniref:Transmembrane protein n=1 Tax=Medicago truncatula TaxID=3880 RepID=I3SBJ0_MEDTR|nr:unknown [Medicago truncatula]
MVHICQLVPMMLLKEPKEVVVFYLPILALMCQICRFNMIKGQIFILSMLD